MLLIRFSVYENEDKFAESLPDISDVEAEAEAEALTRAFLAGSGSGSGSS